MLVRSRKLSVCNLEFIVQASRNKQEYNDWVEKKREDRICQSKSLVILFLPKNEFKCITNLSHQNTHKSVEFSVSKVVYGYSSVHEL